MSRSTFLMTNETPTVTDRCFHHVLMTANRSNETVPIVIQSSTIEPMNKSPILNNPRTKRKLRVKRRSTGIHPDEASVAGVLTEGSANEDDEELLNNISELDESCDNNRTILSTHSSKPMFTVSRMQSSYENLSISETDSYMISSSSSTTNNSALSTKVFLPEEFILRRVDKPTSDDDSLKSQQLEERILKLESLVYEQDAIIRDLQRKVDRSTRDLTDAQEQILMSHQEKLTLIKAFTALQDNKTLSGDISVRSNLVKK
ncbi:unnamed protein product [Rotaria socialis]|uniref:Uncharacterized protein n=2 Tax=Rotaria socialis TaxID=392032 RepID=A0A818E8G2_9BILA|nr:unnamed protein product [Rotaria socialis]